MDTTNSSENPQRRVEDRKPLEVIDWGAPGAPAMPLSPAASTPVAPADPADSSKVTVPRALLARCVSSMKAAVTFGETGRGRPPAQTCMFEIEDLQAALANPAASTTGAAQTAEQVRDQDHVRNLIEYAEDAVRDMRMWMENYGEDDETNDLIAKIEETLSALRPTPTHSSEAGDA